MGFAVLTQVVTGSRKLRTLGQVRTTDLRLTALPVRMDSTAASMISLTPTFNSADTGPSIGLLLRMQSRK